MSKKNKQRGNTEIVQPVDESAFVEEDVLAEEIAEEVVEEPAVTVEEQDTTEAVEEVVEQPDAVVEEPIEEVVEQPDAVVEEAVTPTVSEPAVEEVEEPVKVIIVGGLPGAQFDVINDILANGGITIKSKHFNPLSNKERAEVIEYCLKNDIAEYLTEDVRRSLLVRYNLDEDVTNLDLCNKILRDKDIPAFGTILVNSRKRRKDLIDKGQYNKFSYDELAAMLLNKVNIGAELYIDEDKLFKTAVGKELFMAVRNAIYARRPRLKDVFDWHEPSLIRYLESGNEPKRVNGSLIMSQLRDNTRVMDWSINDINLWIEGHIELPEGVTEDEAMSRATTVHSLPYSMSKDSVRRYLRTGVKPKPNSMGVYKENRFRDASDPRTWSIAELISFLQGWLSGSKSLNEADIYMAIRERFEISADLSDDYIKQHLITLNDVEVPMSNILLKDALDNFVTTISRNKTLTPADAATAHARLYGALQRVLTADESEFFALWGEVLRTAQEHRNTTFNEYNVYTYVEHTNISKDALSVYNFLINAIINTCDPLTRQENKKCVNLEGITQNLTVGRERATNNLVNFYKL